MKTASKKALMWVLPAVVCIAMLSFGDKTYGAELSERSNIADAAVTDGDYTVSDRPEDTDADKKAKGIVEGVHGGPGVSVELSEEEESSETAKDSGNTADESGVFYIDGTAYKKTELVGSFKLTGYCNCSSCGGGQSTYSGTTPRAKHTVAADLSLLPIGTKIVLEGTSGPTVHNFDGIYDVEDKGSGVNGNHIDIYFDTHEEARSVTDPGWQYADVWIAVPVEE